MGIYANRGLEYRVYIGNERFITVLNRNDTDERMTQTPYYKEREDTWFDDSYRSAWARKIVDDIDKVTIVLTDRETELLRSVLDFHPNHGDHGWYDVNTIDCTY